MDDNNVPTLQTSQQEWAIRLSRVIHPLLYEGVQAMFQEAVGICKQSEEEDKYLMTFQNILARIPKWNEEIVKKETSRIIEKSGCSYLEDLLTCVHIAQLKILSSIRTGKSQKKVEIDIPKLNGFVHKVYIHISRELYASVYLFEKGIAPLVFQQNRSKVNEIIKESILNAIRDSIPVEQLLRAYLDETTDFMKEVPKEEPKIEKELKFSNQDSAITVNNEAMVIEAPKDVDTLEKIAEQRNNQRKAEEAAEAEEDKVKISDEVVIIDVEELVPVKVEIEIPKEKKEEIDLGIEILS
uniref:Uncharacterized protein n=1 Tax=viral metagenome TaxID=1070528 RepID=A0A6C0HYI3_9ZZZZ